MTHQNKIKSLMFLLAIVLIPAVSAQKVGNEGNEYDSTRGLTLYANINAYGPSTATTSTEISLYTSGEIGNIINIYFQKFYIINLDTSDTTGVEYTSTPSGWTDLLGTWTKTDYVAGHDTFSSSWKVKLNQAGTYEVVASVVGLGTIPNDQDRFIITVS